MFKFNNKNTRTTSTADFEQANVNWAISCGSFVDFELVVVCRVYCLPLFGSNSCRILDATKQRRTVIPYRLTLFIFSTEDY